MPKDLLSGRSSVHSLEALIHAAEEGQAAPSIPEVSKKELKDAAQCEEAPLVEPEETVEPPEDPFEDVEGVGENLAPPSRARELPWTASMSGEPTTLTGLWARVGPPCPRPSPVTLETPTPRRPGL